MSRLEPTYQEIYEKFVSENRKITPEIENYRPAGYNTIRVFFENGIQICFKYQVALCRFTIQRVETREGSTFLKEEIK